MTEQIHCIVTIKQDTTPWLTALEKEFIKQR